MKLNNYNRFWRMHFYAALFITPLLITLTLSGIGYLFYTNAENALYDDLFFGDSGKEETFTLEEGIFEVNNTYEDYTVSKVIMLDEPYNKRLTLTGNTGDEKYVFLDDNNQIVGDQKAEFTYSNVLRNLHSSLFIGGTLVNYLMELAACWAIFLLLSGIYLTFKGKALQVRNTQNRRQNNKRNHALIGLIITIPMVIIIFTGLPWSAFMGSQINKLGESYPDLGNTEMRYNPPTSDVNEIPWATRSQQEPISEQHEDHKGHAGHHESGARTPNDISNQLSVEEISNRADEEGISRPYSIIYPTDELGVFTVSKGSNSGITGLDVSPYEETTNYFDQYTGDLLGKVDYQNYGVIGKWFTWGIPLHEGHLFGWPNKIINLAVCLGFLTLILLGFMTWLNRKKKGSLSAPIKVSKKLSIGFVSLMVILGLIMPLFGISLILVLILELLLNLMDKRKKEFS
ncbi:sulfite reductase subunit alpha [Oceanobacillus neutriphilus]|uniref:Sulfite reductase subunit alpha n=2 Tax=Oceanobacillus neutriphilus TaxID=531815 RepID=A0ABQ2NRD7_9BACI|nr:PepSY domain-containing protein [Oceanobacillus neutriphilus]GGP08730.1 sulfite reductase subunit alpha [Oceanobacillus neutriphilus]